MTPLMAVPDAKLVTSVLQRRRNVTKCVNVLIHASFFFRVIAPVSSMEDSGAVFQGKRALHLPNLLSIHPAYVLFFFLVPSFLTPLLQLWTLDRNRRSSTSLQ